MTRHLFFIASILTLCLGCTQADVDDPADMSESSPEQDMRAIDMVMPQPDSGSAPVEDLDAGSMASDMLDASSDQEDIPDMRPEDEPEMCSLHCPCGGYCKDGMVTILGDGAIWDGACGNEPTCDIETYQCANGCAQDAPQDEFYNDENYTWCNAAQESWQNFCAPE